MADMVAGDASEMGGVKRAAQGPRISRGAAALRRAHSAPDGAAGPVRESQLLLPPLRAQQAGPLGPTLQENTHLEKNATLHRLIAECPLSVGLVGVRRHNE